jgi:predicted DNA-binding transcriptional regulator YafY
MGARPIMDFDAPLVSHLVVFARAHRASARVRLRYRDVGATVSDREVDVLGLAFQDGRWYALAHCHLRRAIRMFRLDRVAAASVTRRRACGYRLRGFDPAFFATVEFLEPGAPVAHLATVRLEGRLAAAAPALFPGAIVERAGRHRLCHVRVSRVPALARLVQSLGAGASLQASGSARAPQSGLG